MSTAQLDNSRVSRHLGQTSDYARDYDPSLLVREPRQGNRTYLGLAPDDLPFCGYDVWNAYEVSSMTNKGQPVTAVAKIIYPCDNEYIVESKSIKLYFNSYNMARFGDTQEECLDNIKERSEDDLSALLNTNVSVTLFNPSDMHRDSHRPYFDNRYVTIESDKNLMNSTMFDTYNEDPDLLTSSNLYTNQSDYLISKKFHSSLLKSNCRVTGQPDHGDIFVYIKSLYIPSHCDLARYIVSFRDECHFHEEICECVYKRLWDVFTPTELMVACQYTRRGGIDINPIRSSHIDLIPYDFIDIESPYIKTGRQ